MLARLYLTLGAVLLSGCSKPDDASTQNGAAANGVQASADTAEIQLPAGRYELDPAHASLVFKVRHMGLANYVARFTRIKAELNLDPDNLAASSLIATVDMSSV